MAYANAESEDKTVLLIGVAMMIISFVLSIVWGKRIWSSKKLRCIPLKAGQYRVELTEKFVPSGGANMLIGHRIITENDMIQCVSNAPEEDADVDVYVSEDKQGGLVCEYFEYKEREWSCRRLFWTVTGLIVCACALAIPIVMTREYKLNGIITEPSTLLSNMITLMVGGGGILFFRKAKQDLLYKILYYFFLVIYVIGILGVVVSLI